MKNLVGKLRNLGIRALHALGFRHNSRAQKDFLFESNVRIGIYMAGVIVVLEIWMLIRQISEKLIPEYDPEGSFILQFTRYTTTFWMMLLLGASFMAFSVLHLLKNVKRKTAFLINIIFGGVIAIYPLVLLLDKLSSNPVKKAMQIALYVIFAIYGISLIVHALFLGKKGEKRAPMMFVITMFAAVCLVFGMRVSYGDFLEGKEIMCFITMVIYVACLLVWKPYVSLAMMGTIFYFFYYLLRFVVPDTSLGYFQDGDIVNYITLVISLAMVAVSLYHQRIRDANNGERLEHFASYDDITGLHNYRYFLEKASKQMLDPNVDTDSLIYVFINIQNFKLVNDQLGFVAGNEFLKKVGELIGQMFGQEETCRISNDQFGVLTKQEGLLPKLEALNHEVMAINENLALNIACGGRKIPNRNYDPRRAMSRAYHAATFLKGTRGRIFMEYDKKMSEELSLAHYIARNIDKAIEQGWIRPHYQPVVWAKDGSLCGCEALARWVDPTYGHISPGVFVPILEDALLIHKLDQAILEQVCRDIRSSIDHDLPPIPVSINFSRLDFELFDPISVLEGLVEKYGISRDLLRIEITESALSKEAAILKKALTALKEKGYSLWLDDFGSGYSSLNVLKDYEFDVLKLDGKFLSGFDTSAKARTLIISILSLARSIGMETLAEGVETPDQAEFLFDNGCQRLQGYYYGRPMPRGEMYEKYFGVKDVH